MVPIDAWGSNALSTALGEEGENAAEGLRGQAFVRACMPSRRGGGVGERGRAHAP